MLIFKTLCFLLQAYPMNYPTNLLRAFAVVYSWRILRAKIRITLLLCHYCKLRKHSTNNQQFTMSYFEKGNGLATCYLLQDS